MTAFDTAWGVVKISTEGSDDNFPCPLCGAIGSLYPVDDPDEEGVFECQECRQWMGGGY